MTFILCWLAIKSPNPKIKKINIHGLVIFEKNNFFKAYLDTATANARTKIKTSKRTPPRAPVTIHNVFLRLSTSDVCN